MKRGGTENTKPKSTKTQTHKGEKTAQQKDPNPIQANHTQKNIKEKKGGNIRKNGDKHEF